MKILIHQIYYNDQTQKKVLPGFIPLDNTENLRPDWFELWVILNFLKNNALEDDAWYGFLSPNFREKTGFDSNFVIDLIKRYGSQTNVALFSPQWDQLSYFLNPFEQGEVWHPGLKAASQAFLNKYRPAVNLDRLVTDTCNSCFSNYIIAKKEFWVQWKHLASLFFEYVENDLAHQITTSYGTLQNQAPMKTFIQERLASVILPTGGFSILKPDPHPSSRITTRLFPENPKTKRLLEACDLMKRKYIETQEATYLEMYWKLRADIQYSNLSFK